MKQIPEVSFEIDSENDGDFDYGIFDADKLRIGRIAVVTIPGDDRVFVTAFHINQEYRKKGYGLAAVAFVAQQHGDAIVPVQDRSNGFWDHLRNRSNLALTVEDDIDLPAFRRLVDSSAERQRPS